MSSKKTAEFTATGRRKTSVACVRMMEGTGKLTANGRTEEDYFSIETLRKYIRQPLQITNMEASFDVKAKLVGGGVNGQAAALRHGIARALVKSDPSLREVLKDSGFLTRDPRAKERKKPGQPGARKRFQFSKR